MPGAIANWLVGCGAGSDVAAKLSLVPFPLLNAISPASHLKGGGATGPLTTPGLTGAAPCANTATADPASPMHVIAANCERRLDNDFIAIFLVKMGHLKKASICLARTFEASIALDVRTLRSPGNSGLSATAFHGLSAGVFLARITPAMFRLEHVTTGCVCEVAHV